jgi:hypothetical protein
LQHFLHLSLGKHPLPRKAFWGHTQYRLISVIKMKIHWTYRLSPCSAASFCGAVWFHLVAYESSRPDISIATLFVKLTNRIRYPIYVIQ